MGKCVFIGQRWARERMQKKTVGMEPTMAENMLLNDGSCSHFATKVLVGGSSMSGSFPSLFCVLVKFLAHSMIRNMIHGNDYNSDRSSLACVYVHVQILPGNTHAHPQALKPINKPSYLHT